MVDITAVEGKSISMQCPITGTDVAMVLWFRNAGGIPLYRYESLALQFAFFLIVFFEFSFKLSHKFIFLLSAVSIHFVIFLMILVIKDL